MPAVETGDVVCQGQRAVITAHFLPVWTAKAMAMRIRPAMLADLMEIARRMMLHYPTRATNATAIAGAKWICRAINSPNSLVLLSPSAFGIVSIGTYYGCERRARVDILCSRPSAGHSLESLRMVRKMIAWAKHRGFPTLRLEADTGVDFGPFARRLGAGLVMTTKFDIPTR